MRRMRSPSHSIVRGIPSLTRAPRGLRPRAPSPVGALAGARPGGLARIAGSPSMAPGDHDVEGVAEGPELHCMLERREEARCLALGEPPPVDEQLRPRR